MALSSAVTGDKSWDDASARADQPLASVLSDVCVCMASSSSVTGDRVGMMRVLELASL